MNPYQHELKQWAADWANQQKDRHARLMAKHRLKYPAKANLVQILLTVLLPMGALTVAFT